MRNKDKEREGVKKETETKSVMVLTRKKEAPKSTVKSDK